MKSHNRSIDLPTMPRPTRHNDSQTNIMSILMSSMLTLTPTRMTISSAMTQMQLQEWTMWTSDNDEDYFPGNNDDNSSSTSNNSDSDSNDSNSNDSNKADNNNDDDNNPNDMDFEPASTLTDSTATTPALNDNHKTAGVDNGEDNIEDENPKALGVDDITEAKPDTGMEYENDTPNVEVEGGLIRIYQVPANRHREGLLMSLKNQPRKSYLYNQTGETEEGI